MSGTATMVSVEDGMRLIAARGRLMCEKCEAGAGGMVAVFAQLRVDTIRENTMRGLAHAKSQGRVGGRPSKMTPEKIAQAKRMRAENASLDHIAGVLSVGKSTVARALSRPEADVTAGAPSGRQ